MKKSNHDHVGKKSKIHKESNMKHLSEKLHVALLITSICLFTFNVLLSYLLIKRHY